MKINKINLNNLRNDEHFQFHTEFRDLARPQFEAYLPLYGRVDEALKKIIKSSLNAVIAKYTAVLNARQGRKGKKELDNTQTDGGSNE